MNTEDLEWILEIRCKARSLQIACEEFENDVSGSSFDLDDARSFFEAIQEEFEKLKKLLEVL